MKMHKIMYLTVAALLFLMPPVNAQDEESAESSGGAEAGEEKAAESADKSNGGASAETGGEKAKAGEEGSQKTTIFSEHQQRIKTLREKKAKLEEAGRRRDAGKVLDELKQEQKRLKALFTKESAKIKTEIAHLKEQSKKTNASTRKKLVEDITKQQEALKTLEADAAIETWCTEPKDKDASPDKSKTAPKSKSKKSKISRRKKKK